MKKSLLIVMLLAGILLVSCGPKATPAPAPTAVPTQAPPEAKKVSVGLQAASAGWPWYATFISTMEGRAKQAGWKLTVLSKSKWTRLMT